MSTPRAERVAEAVAVSPSITTAAPSPSATDATRSAPNAPPSPRPASAPFAFPDARISPQSASDLAAMGAALLNQAFDAWCAAAAEGVLDALRSDPRAGAPGSSTLIAQALESLIHDLARQCPLFTNRESRHSGRFLALGLVARTQLARRPEQLLNTAVPITAFVELHVDAPPKRRLSRSAALAAAAALPTPTLPASGPTSPVGPGAEDTASVPPGQKVVVDWDAYALNAVVAELRRRVFNLPGGAAVGL